MSRTGLRYGLLYAFSAIGPDFEAANGYVPRSDYVRTSFYNRVSFYWKPGSLVESFLVRQGYDALWLYDKFFDGDAVQETKVQFETVTNIRGGWVVSVTPVRETWRFDERIGLGAPVEASEMNDPSHKKDGVGCEPPDRPSSSIRKRNDRTDEDPCDAAVYD